MAAATMEERYREGIPWQDSLVLPLFVCPSIAVVLAAAVYYNSDEEHCSQFTLSSDSEISVYLCCYPEYYFGAAGFGLTAIFGIPASFQVCTRSANMIQLPFIDVVVLSRITHGSTLDVVRS
jgi:hypothetical protein